MPPPGDGGTGGGPGDSTSTTTAPRRPPPHARVPMLVSAALAVASITPLPLAAAEAAGSEPVSVFFAADERAMLNELLAGVARTIPMISLKEDLILRDVTFTDISISDLWVGFDEPSQSPGSDPRPRHGWVNVSATFAATMTARVYEDADPEDLEDTAHGYGFEDLEVSFSELYLPALMHVDLLNPTRPIAVGDATAATVVYDSDNTTNFYPVIHACPRPNATCEDVVDEIFANLAAPENKPAYEGWLAEQFTRILQEVLNQTRFKHEPPTVDASAVADVQEAVIREFADDPSIVNYRRPNNTAMRLVNFVVDEVYARVNETTGNTAFGEMLTYFVGGGLIQNVDFPLYEDAARGIAVTVTAVRVPVFNVSHLAAAAVGDFSVQVSAQLSGVTVEATTEVVLTNTVSGNVTRREAGHLVFTDVDAEFNVSVLAAINATSYGERYLGSLFPLPHEMTREAWAAWWAPRETCWAVYPLLAFNVSTFTIDLQRYTVADASGVIPAAWANTRVASEAAAYFLRHALRTRMDANVAAYADSVLWGMSEATGGSVPHRPGACPIDSSAPPLPPFDFTNSTAVNLMGFVADTLIGTAPGWGVSGWLAAALREYPPLHEHRAWDWAKYVGVLSLGLHDLALVPDALVTELHLFDPKGRYELGARVATNRTFGCSMGVGIALDGKGGDVHDEFTLGIAASSAVVDAIVTAVVNERRFEYMPVRRLSEPGCLAAELLELAFPSTILEATGYNLTLECTSCSSPLMHNATRTLQTPEGVAQLQHDMADALRAVGDVLKSPKFNDLLAQWLHDANATCSRGDEANSSAAYDYTVTSTATRDIAADDFLMWGGPAAADVDAIPVVTEAPHHHINHGASHWLSTADENSVLFTVVFVVAALLLWYTCWAHQKYKHDHIDDAKANNTTALVAHPALPAAGRYGALAGAALAFTLLLAGMVEPSATVHINVDFAGSPVKVRELYTYTFPTAVKDLWNADAYAVAIIVMILSGMVPLFKLWVSLWCWTAPPCVIPRHRRLRYLDFAAWSGRWGLATVLLICLAITNAQMDFGTPAAVAYLPAGFVKVTMLLSAQRGMVLYILGLVVSSAVSQYMMLMARGCDVADERTTVREGWFQSFSTDRRALVFQRIATEPNSSLLTDLMKLMGLWGGAAGLFVAGCICWLYKFRVDGLAGYAADLYRPGASHTRYNLFSIADEIARQEHIDGEAAGYGLLAILYLTTVFVAPVLQYLGVFIISVIPLTVREQKHVFIVTDIFAAWCGLDVFALVMVAWICSVESLESFFVGDACGKIDSALEWFDVVNPIVPVMNGYEKTCIRLTAEDGVGCWLVLVSACLTNVVYRYIRSYISMLIDCRDAEDEGKTPRYRGSSGLSRSFPRPATETTALLGSTTSVSPRTMFSMSPRPPGASNSAQDVPGADFCSPSSQVQATPLMKTMASLGPLGAESPALRQPAIPVTATPSERGQGQQDSDTDQEF